MKVLFVSSGNSKNGISPIIYNQGESLKAQGFFIDYFTIKGKGIKGYLRNIRPLKRKFKEGKYDVVHAHYSLSAFVATLAGAKPLVVSLMGSDIKAKSFLKIWIKIFVKFVWRFTIVKSQDMKESLSLQNFNVVPNGVDFNCFKPMDKKNCQEQLGWDNANINILFAANPERIEKNYKLVKEAMSIIDDSNIAVHFLKDVPNKDVPLHHNAADVVILSSLWEGSPNVIKEAMACNIPIVATYVGDIKEVLAETEGCYLTRFDPEELADKIKKAIEFDKRTKGRLRIKALGLDSETIASRIIETYKKILIRY